MRDTARTTRATRSKKSNRRPGCSEVSAFGRDRNSRLRDCPGDKDHSSRLFGLAGCGTICPVLGAFTDQAHNLILLAEDEARMLGRPVVEPEHLLLALLRHGNVR